jgi:hypothetical protein
MNHASKATAHEIRIRRMAYFYSAAERRLRGELWPSFAPALIHVLAKLKNSVPAFVKLVEEGQR